MCFDHLAPCVETKLIVLPRLCNLSANKASGEFVSFRVLLCLLQRYINLVFIIISRCGISFTNCILFLRFCFPTFYIAVNTPIFLVVCDILLGCLLFLQFSQATLQSCSFQSPPIFSSHGVLVFQFSQAMV